MKIYFAGSIRAGREDRELYARIIEHLRRHGQVLTEHIGADALPDLDPGLSHDEFIYHRDMFWLGQCDVVIAEVTRPSLGVGYEIGRAEMMGKRILYLYRPGEGQRLSAMIAGNKSLVVKEYRDLDDALEHIDRFFRTVLA